MKLLGFDTTDYRGPEKRIEGVVKNAGRLLARNPIVAGKTRSLIVSTCTKRRSDAGPSETPWELATRENHERIDYCLTAIRLATAGTIQELANIDGQPGWIRAFPADIRRLTFSSFEMVTRVAQVRAELVGPLERLISLLKAIASHGRGEVPSVLFALRRFNRSFIPADWRDQLLDLAIALEAVFGEEQDAESITLRLRTRAAGLLATEGDPAPVIFDDVAGLYRLRSLVVHGRSQRAKDLAKRFAKVSAAQASKYSGIQVELVVDRARDLVRRAILCRIMLSKDPGPPWPLSGENNIDREMAADESRTALRSGWMEGLRELGLPGAANKAPSPEVIG